MSEENNLHFFKAASFFSNIGYPFILTEISEHNSVYECTCRILQYGLDRRFILEFNRYCLYTMGKLFSPILAL